jgi:hypothetical protein
VCLCGDLAEDHDHTGLGGSLASDLGEGVLPEAGIEDGIRDLIAVVALVRFGGVGNVVVKWGCVIHLMESRSRGGKIIRGYIPDLVGVALTDRLGGEEEGVLNNGKSRRCALGAFS